MDWNPLVQAGASFVTLVVIPWGIYEYRRRTGVELTAQQRAAIDGALNTAKGIIETKLDQGKLSVQDVQTGGTEVRKQAAEALQRVPDAAKAQEVTTDSAAAIIVGRVDTSKAADSVQAVVSLKG